MLSRPLAWALFAAPVLAQSNAVPGLDISVYDVTDIAYYGHRGAAYPAGEAGFMVGHSHCNHGTVNLPWISVSGGVMVDSYPRLAFLLARESGGRMVQISGQGHSKHSPTAFNFASGPCAPCQAGSGSFFFVGCSDTYGSGINSSQYALGPNHEINPWLGTWNPIGSYFDRGDPAVSGPAATDGVRSLTSTAGWDPVKNRIVVRETELVAGASYVAQVHGVYQGEPVQNRGDNIVSRQVSITGGAGGLSVATTGASAFGSVLTRWTGATWAIGGNGQDDGRFLVAVKVTGPVAGLYHYEYAVQNLDNSRGAAVFRIPIAPGAVVQNLGFRDIDTDPLDDWTAAVGSNSIAFQAVGTNSLEWNTFYNCWFDCSVPPGAGTFAIDQARPGAGALTVGVAVDVPSGLSYANKFAVGAPCGLCTGTFYEQFAGSSGFDLGGRSMTLSLAAGAYTATASNVAFVPPAGQNLNLGLNTQAVVALPFALPFPGGSTTQLRVCSSGYVSPGGNAVQLLPSPSMLLQGQPRWAVLWTLLQPTSGTANNVWFDATPARAIVTWNNVPFLSGTAPSTFQLQLFPDGTAHMVWQNVAASSFATMVGWSTGGNHYDPGASDLSTALNGSIALCSSPFDGMRLGANANPVLGTTVQWELTGVPVGAGWGALLRSLTQAVPPIDLSAAGMPGCFAHVVNPVATLLPAPASSTQVMESIPNNTALIGVSLVGQAVAFEPTLTALGLVATNAMVLTLGM